MKRKLQLEDMRNIDYISAPAVSPEGGEALYVVSRSNARGAFDSDIHIINIATRQSSPLIWKGTFPAYSPDGKYISFLRDAQIWLMDRSSGEMRKFSTLRHGITHYSWSADGQHIAFCTPLWEGEENCAFDELTGEKLQNWQEKQRRAPKVIENLMYKLDEWYGVQDGRASCVGMLDINGGAGRLLTERLLRAFCPVFSPDGSRMAFFGMPHSHVHEMDAELFICEVATGKIEEIATLPGMLISDEPVKFTLDGGLIFTAYKKRDGAYITELFKKPIDGEIQTLFPENCPCHGVGAATIGFNYYGRRNPSYIVAGDDIFFRSAWDGYVNIYGLSDSGVRAITADSIDVHDFAHVPGGDFVIVRGDIEHLPELYMVDGKTGEQTRLTHHNAWLDNIELAQPIEMRVPTPDGKETLHGYVVPPTRREDGRRYPAVLDIHGGPTCVWGCDFWFEFQLLAARGFAVAYCDPRGSAGYGGRFQSYNCWGQEPIDDLRAFMDAAEKLGFIDATKWGVTGGSYGGYMTNKLIMNTEWFAAAVTQRSLSNLATSYGTGDMGFIYDEKGGMSQRRNFAERVEKSPIGRVDDIHVPLLILHATNDYRCGFEQGEQMFIAMKDRHPELPVRFVAFPGENHGLTREGKIHLQISHLEEMARWFDIYLNGLKGGENR